MIISSLVAEQGAAGCVLVGDPGIVIAGLGYVINYLRPILYPDTEP